ncbi:histidine kinase [Insulibacter thermoxylanivorax]|uniref:Histidine kinase n=1 Tax=Insulibacter thermoxylanivorax TaxID=2749268 RepID=A0A916VF25_9BACL|nr:helix-turn-helix domain-containing protein [Insulibacter thermoxylanivorax]GFR37852.1 histidine kinase [Insulibacter thermoxylanivorax]
MKGNTDFQEYVPIMHILHSVTKMDVRLIDQSGDIFNEIIIHEIPAVLEQPKEDFKHILGVLRQHEPERFYQHISPYGLEYIASGIWEAASLAGAILLGPLLSSQEVIHRIQDIIMDHQLAVSDRQLLEEFYQSLPILSDEEHTYVGKLLGHLCQHPRVQSQQIPPAEQKPYQPVNFRAVTMEESYQIIERRYEHQNRLMDAITKGDKERVKHEVSYLLSELPAFSERIPENPIRTSKNLGFVLNTMCRIAAERSGVHPVYLHHLSERYAILVERTSTFPLLKNLFQSMVMDYCDLVISTSTGNYSAIVKKAVDYIMLNLGQPLPLQEIAEHIHVNPSHLSRKFKEDTGMTITEFINRKRIEEAALYLQRSRRSVTEVAFMVGFNDLNYFSKVFKKIMNETPTQYAKRRRH